MIIADLGQGIRHNSWNALTKGVAMTYIYYANKYSEAGEMFHQTLQSAFRKSSMERCRTIGELTKRLYKSIYDISAVILLIDDRTELEAILSLKDVLWDVKLIIILSSQANFSPLEVLTLRPRFFTWTESDFSQVVDVLGNMMGCKPEKKGATVKLLNQIAQKKLRKGENND
jgi:hypothetical protein